MQPEEIVVCVLGGLVLMVLGVIFGSYATLRVAHRLLPERLPSLDYELCPVASAQESEFRRVYPTAPRWEDFAKGVLDNPKWSKFHPALRAAQRQAAAQFAGMSIFVRVRNLPA